MNSRPLLSFGSLSLAASTSLERAASDVGCRLEHVETPAKLGAQIADTGALAVVLDIAQSGAEDACNALRRNGLHGHVPILAMSADHGDVPFLELFQWGGDDMVAETSAALVRRLRPLVGVVPSDVKRERPIVVVAGADARWRMAMGRSLGNAGVEVMFATNAEDTIAVAKTARFVIADHALAPNGASAAIDRARSLGVETPWVVVAPPKRLPGVQACTAALDRVSLVDAFAPPETALFVGNELAYAPTREDRHGTRLPFGTTVRFRVAGRDVEDDLGFSYNVSEGGMYVRTLAPPVAGEEVWLELHAPRTDRRVRLVGRVAWARPFGRSATATVPPGFGVQITGGLGADIERYRAGCDALADAMMGVPKMPVSMRHSYPAAPSLLAAAIV